MATISRSVSWTLLTTVDDAFDRIHEAVKGADFLANQPDRGNIDIDIPRSIMKNRWAAKIHGDVRESPRGTEVTWTVDGLGNKHFEHLGSIAEHLPDGLLYDHGIPAATEKLANRIFGRKEIRHLVNVLDADELVRAIGVGQYASKAGIAVLTDKRLFFMEKSMLGSEDMTEFALDAIGAISLSKKMSGETLTITHSGTKAEITTLGHGQGDSIVRSFRQLKEQPKGATAPEVSVLDPLVQIERLADLHSKGILTDEEFQTQKAQLLKRM